MSETHGMVMSSCSSASLSSSGWSFSRSAQVFLTMDAPEFGVVSVENQDLSPVVVWCSWGSCIPFRVVIRSKLI